MGVLFPLLRAVVWGDGFRDDRGRSGAGGRSGVGGDPLRNTGLPRRSSRPVPHSSSRRTALTENLSDEEAKIYQDLAGRAGVVAARLLAERGLIYLEDLKPEAARELLRAAWREAARERFSGLDISELDAEIDAVVDSLILITPTPDGATLH